MKNVVSALIIMSVGTAALASDSDNTSSCDQEGMSKFAGLRL